MADDLGCYRPVGPSTPVGPGQNQVMARLRKPDVEILLATYDADPVDALTVALRRVLDRPDATWPELLGASGLPDDTVEALRTGRPTALDDLATTLNELRTLPHPG